MMYVSQIVILYTINMHSALCQLYLNKTGGKKCMAAILFDTQNPIWSVDVSILLRCRFDMVVLFSLFDWLLNFLPWNHCIFTRVVKIVQEFSCIRLNLAFLNITNVTLVFIKTKKLCRYSTVNYRLYSHPTSFPPEVLFLPQTPVLEPRWHLVIIYS